MKKMLCCVFQSQHSKKKKRTCRWRLVRCLCSINYFPTYTALYCTVLHCKLVDFVLSAFWWFFVLRFFFTRVFLIFDLFISFDVSNADWIGWLWSSRTWHMVTFYCNTVVAVAT